MGAHRAASAPLPDGVGPRVGEKAQRHPSPDRGSDDPAGTGDFSSSRPAAPVASASAEENVRVGGGVLGHHTPFIRTVLNLPSVLAIRKDTASVGFPSAAISAKEEMIPVS